MTTFDGFMEAIGEANSRESAVQVFLDLIHEVASQCGDEEKATEIYKLYESGTE